MVPFFEFLDPKIANNKNFRKNFGIYKKRLLSQNLCIYKKQMRN